MPTVLSTNALERSTYAITVAFADETGAPVTPDSGLRWTLTDAAGAVVNNRAAVSITEDTSITIVLTDADLAISGDYASNVRVVTIEGTYTSSLGSGLALRDQVEFQVTNLIAVS